MGRVATTVDQQIEMLKERGMVITNVEKCKEILLDIGYYRLGFYWNHFETNHPQKHFLKPNTKIEDVVKLYYLDVDLRNILLKYISRLELNFRTQVIYQICNATNNPIWYIDRNVVNRECIDYFDKNYHQKFKINSFTLKNHHEKYINDKYAPAWKTLEFVPFGGVLTAYKALKNTAYKQGIANAYGIRKVEMFENFLTAIVHLRNMCSHANVLFDMAQPKRLLSIPGSKPRNMYSLWASILAVKFMINRISENRYKDLKMQVENLFENFRNDDVIRDIIENKICYDFSKN